MEDPTVPANAGFGTCCVEEGCPCLGDVVTNGQVDFDDLFNVIDMVLGADPTFVVPVAAGHCADVAPEGNPNLQVDFDDLFAIIDAVLAADPTFVAPCM
jgi:hypothetical protein